MSARAKILIAAGLAATLGSASFAQGLAMNDDERQLFLSGYIFASGITGDVSTVGPLPDASIDLKFSDVIKDLEGGAMAMVEYRSGRWSLIGDLMHSYVRPSGNLPGSLIDDVELKQRQTTLQGNVLYRAYATPDMRVDVGGGLRYWHLNNQVTVTSPVAPTVTGTQEKDWIDPVIAVRFQTRINEKWRATFFADYGGFGAGSDETWQIVGTFDYSLNEKLLLRAGYRVLSTDYRDGNFRYDVTMHGPLIGLTYRF